MKTRYILPFIILVFLLLVLTPPDINATTPKDQWHRWLKEIESIMTQLERSVAGLLETQEERDRFRQLFWKARDPNPNTPQNEYKEEFYRRCAYAKTNLKGMQSDRGRIYILLGPPTDKSSFGGYNSLVEAELWSYEGNDRPGILPFMNLVFFRPHNIGDYQLYYPGLHSPTDLLAPQYANRIKETVSAYNEIKLTSTQLAGASLSIVPGEGDIRMGTSGSSSNFAISRIYTLPEREAEAGYIRNFKNLTGKVEVTHTTNVIRGFGNLAITRNKGMYFINYALMPDIIHWQQPQNDRYSLELQVNISVEQPDGTIFYQNQREINLKLNLEKKNQAAERRMVITYFIPIIPGDYTVIISFMDKSNQEFFTYRETVTIPAPQDSQIHGVVGYNVKEIHTDSFVPYAADNYKVLTDPRFIYSQQDTLAGLLWGIEAKANPELILESLNQNTIRVKIQPEKTGQPDIMIFKQPLEQVKDGKYRLIARMENGQIKTLVERIHILPNYIEMKKPYALEKTEKPEALYDYYFVQGQQYMNRGDLEPAIAQFRQIPESLWKSSSVPVIAQAFYKKGDYKKVLELLEPEDVKKDYYVVLMLANSSIEMKHYSKALTYLEQIKKYNETQEINYLLAATYLNLGNRKKAMEYYELGRKLKNQPEVSEKSKGKDSCPKN